MVVSGSKLEVVGTFDGNGDLLNADCRGYLLSPPPVQKKIRLPILAHWGGPHF